MKAYVDCSGQSWTIPVILWKCLMKAIDTFFY